MEGKPNHGNIFNNEKKYKINFEDLDFTIQMLENAIKRIEIYRMLEKDRSKQEALDFMEHAKKILIEN